MTDAVETKLEAVAYFLIRMFGLFMVGNSALHLVASTDWFLLTKSGVEVCLGVLVLRALK